MVVYNRAGAVVANFLAYPPNFRGGVRVAVGDVNGDGVADIITAPGPRRGQPIQVIDGTQLALLGSGRVPPGALLHTIFAQPRRFEGGFFVAAGDVNGDGSDDIVVGLGEGASRVFVYDGETGARVANFKAYDNRFKEGVTVAAGDVNGDNRADIIVAPESGAQRVIVANAALLPTGGGKVSNAALLGNFFPLQPGFRGGFFVAAGDVNGDLRADVIIAPASDAAPNVRVVNGLRLNDRASSGRIRGSALLANQAVFAQSFRGGIPVGAFELDLDGLAEVIVAGGPSKRQLLAVDVLSRVVELSRRLPFDGGSIGGT